MTARDEINHLLNRYSFTIDTGDRVLSFDSRMHAQPYALKPQSPRALPARNAAR